MFSISSEGDFNHPITIINGKYDRNDIFYKLEKTLIKNILSTLIRDLPHSYEYVVRYTYHFFKTQQ